MIKTQDIQQLQHLVKANPRTIYHSSNVTCVPLFGINQC